MNDYVVSVMEMEPSNLLALCNESRQMAKNITKRSAKGQLTSSSTQAQAQPAKALGCHALLKEGCPATQAWVYYAWCTVIWYWLAQFHHCRLLHLAPLCHNHPRATAYTVYIIWTFWHHLLQFLTIPHSYMIQLLYAGALVSGLT